MMRTEEEARKTRCGGPEGCGAWVHEDDAPDMPNNGYVRYCIASDCMAWRWKSPDRRQNWAAHENVPPPVPDAGWEPDGDVFETTKELPKPHQEAGERQFSRWFVKTGGYCGLAGKPEA